jgi:hypothetical protein
MVMLASDVDHPAIENDMQRVVKVYEVSLLLMKYGVGRLEEKEIVVVDENDVEMVVNLYDIGLLKGESGFDLMVKENEIVVFQRNDGDLMVKVYDIDR